MPLQGPQSSRYYLERTLSTRVPSTPAPPNNLSSNFAASQTDPGIGIQNPGDGIVLASLFTLVVSAYANPGQTFSGTGSAACWIYNPFQQVWTRNVDLDLDFTPYAGLSVNAITFSTFRNASRLGMLINWLPSGVGLGGGPDFLMRIDGFQSVGSQGAS